MKGIEYEKMARAKGRLPRKKLAKNLVFYQTPLGHPPPRLVIFTKKLNFDVCFLPIFDPFWTPK